MNENQAILAAAMTEKELQESIIDLLAQLGYEYREPAADEPNKLAAQLEEYRYLSDPGWPDLWVGHPVTGITGYIELKTEIGTLDRNQKEVLAFLADIERASGGMFFVRLWRPRHWHDDTILDELVAKSGRQLQ